MSDFTWDQAWNALCARVEEQRESAATPVRAGEIVQWMGLEPTQELADVVEAACNSGFDSALADDQVMLLAVTYGIAVGKLYAEGNA